MTTPAPTALGSSTDDEFARLRLTNRLAVAFLLDVIAITRGDKHVLDTLLMSAVIHANVREINRRADLQSAFARSDELPPDDLRAPISMNALASSLEIPFETVRRRVTALARERFCVFVEGGVIVPSAVLADPSYFADAFRVFQRLQAFYYELGDLELLGELPPGAELSAETFPVRAVARILGAYVLRAVEALGAMGDLLDGILLLEIFRGNVEGLSPHRPGPGEVLTDELRVPISILTLARRIGAPYETVRRHAAALLERGVVARVRGGLIVPARALEDPRLPAILAHNAANLRRLFATLAQLGVLRLWDGARPA